MAALRRQMIRISTPLVALAAAALLTAPVASVAAYGIAFDMPRGWVPSMPSSSMRVAEFALPRAEGDAEDASLVVYFFGGSGGSVQANIDRWVSQMTQPDGASSAAAAMTRKMTSTTGLSMTVVDVSGTYVAEVTPGSPERFNKPGFRLIAAYVDTPDGPYYIKLVGPAPTIAKWHESVEAFLRSVRSANLGAGSWDLESSVR